MGLSVLSCHYRQREFRHDPGSPALGSIFILGHRPWVTVGWVLSGRVHRHRVHRHQAPPKFSTTHAGVVGVPADPVPAFSDAVSLFQSRGALLFLLSPRIVLLAMLTYDGRLLKWGRPSYYRLLAPRARSKPTLCSFPQTFSSLMRQLLATASASSASSASSAAPLYDD
jgi:hypothetical protein